MSEKWFRHSIADIEKKLKTNAASGLSPMAARSRRNKGAGQLFFLPRRPLWRIALDIFSDFALIILILGAAFSLFFEVEEYLKGLTVLAIALVALAFCFIVYYRSQRTLESLNRFFYSSVRVIRGGRLFAVDYRSVVVGDVILLEKGDVLTVDARLVSSENLRVKMRTSVNEYTLLEKDANAAIDSREIHARNMSNMVHGGSVILSGNARAIVCAVGKYTYLGAMTGGISLPVSKNRPKLLEKMRKIFAKLNMMMLIGVLPYTMVSLLLGNMLSERQSVLSVAFLGALSIAATSLPQLTCVLLRTYYSHVMRKAVTSRNPAVVRSVEALDKLADADYIFMLDGCAVTDGILHLESAICAEGEIRIYSSLNKTARMLSEYSALYYNAATQTLTTGVGGASDYMTGLKDFIVKTKVDIGGLKIRCEQGKYFTGNMIDTPEKLFFRDRGKNYCLSVWKSKTALGSCKNIVLNGSFLSMREEGRKNFERLWDNAQTRGEIPILFTISSETCGYTDDSFLGIIILKEGIDTALEKNLATLDKSGCKVISFTRRGQTPKMPSEITGRGCVVKASFERNKLPITYNFGSISAYSDMSDDDIILFIEFAHSQNKKVAVIGFTESALKISRHADGFITCSDINAQTAGYLNEELHTTDMCGQGGSVRCAQIIKERADCIIPRPDKTQGGLLSLIALLCDVRIMYRNMSDYLRYSIAIQIIRFIMVGVPMFFGDAILDARHIMLCSFVLDLFVFFAFMTRERVRSRRREKNYCDVNSLKEYFIGDEPMIISSVCAAVVAIVLPRIADFIGGDYDYKLECLFTSLLLLQIVFLGIAYYGNNFAEIKNIYKNKLLIIEVIAVLMIWILFFTLPSVGVLFGVEGIMSPTYFVISLIPSAVAVTIFAILNRKKQAKNF